MRKLWLRRAIAISFGWPLVIFISQEPFEYLCKGELILDECAIHPYCDALV